MKPATLIVCALVLAITMVFGASSRIGQGNHTQTGAGEDTCSKINRELRGLPEAGGTVDARHFVGTQACGSNPFDGVHSSGVLLLGNTAFLTTASWVIPKDFRVLGQGRGDARHAINTTIRANPGFPANSAVLQLGTGPRTSGIRIEDLTIDCNGQPGSTGLQNLHSQEQTGARHVGILNCTAAGLDVEGSGAQNSGPYEDLEVLNASAGGVSAVPVIVSGVPAFRGIHGLTVNAEGTPEPRVGLQIDASGTFNDLHCEHVSICIAIGSKHPTSAVVVSNLECGPGTQTCAEISALHSAQDILLSALMATSGDILRDEIFDTTLRSASMAFYLIGNGPGAHKARISSDVRIAPQFPGLLRNGVRGGACSPAGQSGKKPAQLPAARFRTSSCGPSFF